MGATEAAKEIARIASTAGLDKDVIDLLNAKTSLLEDKIESLERDNAQLTQKVTDFMRENETLKKQLAASRPKGELSPEAVEILKYFFAVPGHFRVTVPNIMQKFGLVENVAKYHLELLYQKDYVDVPGFVMGGGGPLGYKITSKGRGYCIENALVS